MRDVSAASLRRGQTNTIGVIVPRLTDHGHGHAVRGAGPRLRARSGRFAIVATTEDEPRADRAAALTLLQRGVDGLVLSTAREGMIFRAGELADRGVPYVLALRSDGRSLPPCGDDRLGGYLATRHLIDSGTAGSASSPARPMPPAVGAASPVIFRRWRKPGSRRDPAMINESNFWHRFGLGGRRAADAPDRSADRFVRGQ